MHRVAHSIPEPSISEIVAETRETYQGPLIVGEDLMSFEIREGGIAVYRGAP